MSFIETMVSDMCNLSLDNTVTSSLSNTLSSYNASVNNTVITIMRDSVFAVGATLLTLFMLIELIAIINRTGADEQGLGGIKIPANLMIKFAIFAFLFCHIPAILAGIQEVAANIGSNMINSANFNFNVGISSSQVTQIATAIDDLDFFNRIFTYILILLAWCVVKIVLGIVSLTVIFRMFELWIMIMFAPIPLATLASQDFKQTAINFLKGFTAVSLQGAAIIACFLIYQALITNSFVKIYDPAIDISEYIGTLLINNIMYVTALAISVMGSSRIVKQMMNAV